MSASVVTTDWSGEVDGRLRMNETGARMDWRQFNSEVVAVPWHLAKLGTAEQCDTGVDRGMAKRRRFRRPSPVTALKAFWGGGGETTIGCGGYA